MKQSKLSTLKDDITTTERILVIVESPSKCDKIASFLNDVGSGEAAVVATVIPTRGHIYHIDSLKDIDLKNGKFEINYKTLNEKYVVELRKHIKKGKYTRIILATDDDREGEFIAWSICDLFKLPVETTPRIIFHEITKPAILEAMASPTVINLNLVSAQKCRSVLDILIGYKISPILWKYLLRPPPQNNTSSAAAASLSAGRCQTPALALLLDAEIAATNEQLCRTLVSKAIFNDISMTLTPPLAISTDGSEEDHHTTTTTICDFIKREMKEPHKPIISEPTISTNAAPLPFNTSTLLQQASLTLHMSPKQTMQYAQQLYQDGFITYIRTESTKISPIFSQCVREYVINSFGEEFTKKAPEIGVLPHEAIRCTNIETTTLQPPHNDPQKNRLYKLIWRHTIYSVMADSKTRVTKIQINSHTPFNVWKTQLEEPVFLGWRILTNEESRPVQPQKLTDNTPIILSLIEISDTFKQKVNHHYTESGLIKKLEDMGIGRPSTFHTIVETIKDRGYTVKGGVKGTVFEERTFTAYPVAASSVQIKRTKKIVGEEHEKLLLTDLGRTTLNFLKTNFEPLFRYDYTAHMENLLDTIASGGGEAAAAPITKTGEINIRTICDECLTTIKGCINTITTTTPPFTFEQSGAQYEVYYSIKAGPLVRNVETKDICGPLKADINLADYIEGHATATLDALTTSPLTFGSYNEYPIIGKTGRFGPYLQCGTKNIAVKNFVGMTAEKAVALFVAGGSASDTDNKILRTIDANTSIRKGKYAKPYVYYKTPEMKTPQFIPLKGDIMKTWETCSPEEFSEWWLSSGNVATTTKKKWFPKSRL
jgi:DNA topoisomerase-1